MIDAEAQANIARHVERLRRDARLIAESPPGSARPTHIAPVAFEIANIAEMKKKSSARCCTSCAGAAKSTHS